MDAVMLGPEAPKDCPLCPRLVGYRQDNQRQTPDWFNGAVPSFGDDNAELLIVGLAPGLTGANRTGRPFTGDWAGDLLYATLAKFGLSSGCYDKRLDDGLELNRAMITNAVRCAPPQNKPVGAEVNACRPYLLERISSLPQLQVILPLGKIAHDSTLRALGERLAARPFIHGGVYEVDLDGRPLSVISSYHCSRYNTNTGRLTETMFEKVFKTALELINGAPAR